MGRFRRNQITGSHLEDPASSTPTTGARITVRVVEDTHTYAADDGSVWWSGGYAPVYEDEDGEHYFMALGEHLSDGRVLYCKVAGARHYPEALESSMFAPGSATLLRPEPDNPYDADAVGIWDRNGAVQVGHIPADHSPEVASRIHEGEQLVGFVVREIRRGSKSGPRSALHLLVLPAGELSLSVVENG